MLVAFKDACVGVFADSAGESMAGKGGGGGSLAPWGTRTMAAPIDLIVVGNAMVVAIVVIVVVVVVSCNVAAEGGVGRAVPPLSPSLSTLAQCCTLTHR